VIGEVDEVGVDPVQRGPVEAVGERSSHRPISERRREGIGAAVEAGEPIPDPREVVGLKESG
jgi:hypothetical protein